MAATPSVKGTLQQRAELLLSVIRAQILLQTTHSVPSIPTHISGQQQRNYSSLTALRQDMSQPPGYSYGPPPGRAQVNINVGPPPRPQGANVVIVENAPRPPPPTVYIGAQRPQPTTVVVENMQRPPPVMTVTTSGGCCAIL